MNSNGLIAKAVLIQAQKYFHEILTTTTPHRSAKFAFFRLFLVWQ